MTDPTTSPVEPTRVVTLDVDGGPMDVELFEPEGPGPHAGAVLGAEAGGVNEFIREIAAQLAHRGVVAAIPDYYRGDGPPDPEDYDDIETLMSYIARIDFVRAGRDQLAALDLLRSRADVDPDRVAVWGYCTGATLSGLAAVADRRLAAAVLFYPSQPVFEEHTLATPADLMDLLWLLDCPTMVVYGDDDVVMPPERLAELRRRLEAWGVDHRLVVPPGAGHAFCCPSPVMHHAEAAATSAAEAFGFVTAALGLPDDR